MADEIYYIEGFEANAAAKYGGQTYPQYKLSSSGYLLADTASRWAGQVGFRGTNLGTRWVECELLENKNSLVATQSWRRTTDSAALRRLISIRTSAGVDVAFVDLTADEKFQVGIPGDAAMWTAAVATVADTWQTIELGVDTTLGTLEFRIDGAIAFSADSLTLAAVRIVRFGKFAITGYTTGAEHHQDDLVVANYFSGGGRIWRRNVTADSAVEFLRNSGANNFGQVDDSGLLGAHDSDATYVYSEGAGASPFEEDVDLYDLADVDPTVEAVTAMSLTVVARQDNTDTRKFKPLLKLGATTVEGGEFTTTTSYVPYTYLWTDKPGGSGFDPADFATPFQVGMKLTG
jgi:hypothetical protein